MARNTSVSLGDHFAAFVDEQVHSGRYATASDVVRAGLRLLEKEEQQLSWLRGKIAEADAQYRAGNVIEVNDRFWQELESEVAERIARGEEPSDDVLP